MAFFPKTKFQWILWYLVCEWQANPWKKTLNRTGSISTWHFAATMKQPISLILPSNSGIWEWRHFCAKFSESLFYWFYNAWCSDGKQLLLNILSPAIPYHLPNIFHNIEKPTSTITADADNSVFGDSPNELMNCYRHPFNRKKNTNSHRFNRHTQIHQSRQKAL